MKITKNILTGLSNSQVYNALLNEIGAIYEKYHYLNISSEIMDKIVDDEINLSRDNYNDNGNYAIYLKNRVEARILTLGTKLFNDNKINYHLISNYINEYFQVPTDYLEAKKYLKQICNLFYRFSYIPEPNTIINLINSNCVFAKILEVIAYNHKDYFKNYGINQLFSDSNMASIIGIYCMVHGIVVNENYDYKDDKVMVDSLGEYFNEINSVEPITVEEMQELGKRIKLGDEGARNRLTEGNLKLVVSIAKAFYGINNIVSLEDLINAGNIGLMKAASKFDIDLEFRFSTYATYWIRLEIQREIQNNGRTIRIPIETQVRIKSYNRLKEQLMHKLGREVRPEEMAKEMQISIDDVVNYERIQESIISLNFYYGDDEDTEMQDLICTDDFTTEIDTSNSMIDVHKLFDESGLTDRQKEVLLLRYGYYDGSPRTLEEIGKLYGVTRERIRQIEAKALYKLRTCESIKQLVQNLDNPKKLLEILDEFKIAYSDNILNKNKTNPLVDNENNIVKRKVK